MAESVDRWRTPGRIAGVRIKNRIMYPPLSGNCAESGGGVSAQILAFYERIARGGCGSCVVSGAAICSEGKGSDRSLCLYDRSRHLPGYTRLAERIRQRDCFAAVQLMHVGGQGNPRYTGGEPVSPSGRLCRATGFASRALRRDEIPAIRDAFVDSARLAYDAGFLAVELHLAHGYLLHEFLSPRSNQRTDVYGGSFENRLRLVLEILAGIRQTCAGLIVGARVSGNDFLPGGLDFETNETLFPALQAAGVAYFSVTAGVYDTSDVKHREMKRGRFFDFARETRSLVDVPVVGAGKVLDVASAERHLAAERCDFVAMGRALLADPELVAKAERGEAFDRCIECHRCMYLRLGRDDLYCPIQRAAPSRAAEHAV